MQHIFSAVLLLGFAMELPARDWQVEPGASKLEFSGTYQNEAFQGIFQKFEASIRYAPEELSNAVFDVTIDVASVNTSNEERDSALAGEDFFFFAKYPKAHFTASQFNKGADGTVVAIGTLTLRGKSKPVNLGVKFVQTGEKAVLDVAAKLNRLDFDIGSGDWKDPSLIGADVQVHGHLALSAKPDS